MLGEPYDHWTQRMVQEMCKSHKKCSEKKEKKLEAEAAKMIAGGTFMIPWAEFVSAIRGGFDGEYPF